jgi:chloramphenicol 3-O-phosphotransferase
MSSVWLITGTQASGKSTVADLLARRFPRSVHVRGGQFYRWAVQGWVHFDGDDQTEARRMLELRYRLSALSATEYAAAGFTTVVQDNIYGSDVARWLDTVSAEQLHLVVLRPSIEVVEQRHEQRRRHVGKVAFRPGFTAAINDEHLAATPPLGLWLDTSDQTPDETVDSIVHRASEALIS